MPYRQCGVTDNAITGLTELLRQYSKIAFLMGRPQDLPAGAAQMKLGIAFALVTYVLALAGISGVGPALAQAVIDIGFTAVALYAALAITGRIERFQQSFGGYCGSSAFINIAAIPIYLSASGDDGDGMIGSAQFLLVVWGLSLLALIIRQTFEIGIAFSVLLSFCWIVVLVNIMAVAMPAPAPIVSGSNSVLAPDDRLSGLAGALVDGLLTVI